MAAGHSGIAVTARSKPSPCSGSGEYAGALCRELETKDLLLRELGHRVRNSLSIIVSLASIEADGITDKAAAAGIERLASRVTATALLYDKLESQTGKVPMDEYIGDLVDLLVKSLAAAPEGINLELSLLPVTLGAKEAASVGLVVNEAVTNAFKYGLMARQGGRLRVELAQPRRGQLRLSIEDDGPGFPVGFDIGKNGDFGFTLMEAEADSLGGKLSFGPGPGAAVIMDFPQVRARRRA
jgi:two-component sensor histidine kinase